MTPDQLERRIAKVAATRDPVRRYHAALQAMARVQADAALAFPAKMAGVSALAPIRRVAVQEVYAAAGTYAEAARRLGVHPKTVRTTMVRARALEGGE